jgi:hypothetical protein
MKWILANTLDALNDKSACDRFDAMVDAAVFRSSIFWSYSSALASILNSGEWLIPAKDAFTMGLLDRIISRREYENRRFSLI